MLFGRPQPVGYADSSGLFGLEHTNNVSRIEREKATIRNFNEFLRTIKFVAGWVKLYCCHLILADYGPGHI